MPCCRAAARARVGVWKSRKLLFGPKISPLSDYDARSRPPAALTDPANHPQRAPGVAAHP